MSVRQRFLRGLGASALGSAVTMLVQVISVPVFLAAWGTRLYGEWLILTAIPTYLALSDIGFGSVAANDMTIRAAREDRAGALETFQSCWLLISASSLAAGTLCVAAACLLPLALWLNLAAMGPAHTRVVLSLLCLYALLSLQADIIAAGFRCQGRYAQGMLLKNLLRLAETLTVTVMVAFSRLPIEAAPAIWPSVLWAPG